MKGVAPSKPAEKYHQHLQFPSAKLSILVSFSVMFWFYFKKLKKTYKVSD